MMTRTFFKYCRDNKYTPNQLYTLFCVKYGIVCDIPKLNEDYEIRELVHNNLLNPDGRSITAAGLKVLDTILKVIEKKATSVVEVEEEYALKYLEIFPKMILPSNKPARVSKKIIMKQLTWFFTTYPQYDKDLVLKATAYYVETFREQEFKFMRTSQYFISKEATNRMITSTLAEFCQLILDGLDDDEKPQQFKTKVV